MALSGILQRGERYLNIVVAKRKGSLSMGQRALQARWLGENEDAVRRLSLGTAFVFESALARFAFSGVLLLRSMPMDYTVCATLEEAVSWAVPRCAAAGLTVRRATARRSDI